MTYILFRVPHQPFALSLSKRIWRVANRLRQAQPERDFVERHGLYAVCMRFFSRFCLEKLMDAACSYLENEGITTDTQRKFKSRHSERSEESCEAWQKIPRCARNDKLNAFLCVLCASVVNQAGL
jgi:hypothetical protein